MYIRRFAGKLISQICRKVAGIRGNCKIAAMAVQSSSLNQLPLTIDKNIFLAGFWGNPSTQKSEILHQSTHKKTDLVDIFAFLW